MGHVIRGFILIFALGLPRMLYYIYGAYGVLVLSGVMDRLQSVQIRRLLMGTRQSLDLQLARLRVRIETIEKLSELEEAQSLGKEVDEEEIGKHRAYLEQFTPMKPWFHRFMYQLPALFIYSALPWCNPHSEYLT
jgi:hypothetical protein